MSETPHSPEGSKERYLSADSLTEVQGMVNRLVLEDDQKKDLGKALLSVHSTSSHGVKEIAVIRWNKDISDEKPDPVSAIVRFSVGLTEDTVSDDVYTIGITPELSFHEFLIGPDSYRQPISELGAKELIDRLKTFLPEKDQ
jgi:hypothetical protein